MNTKGRLIIIAVAPIVLSVIAACGAGNRTAGDRGVLSLKVSGARSFNPHIEHGRIDLYRVTISGDKIEPPIVAEFPGDADGGVVEGIPVGEGRTVTVEAVNPNQSIIRAGETTGVKIDGGTNEVAVQMEAVPIFTNIADGNTTDNTRLVFKIFSDPANPVVMEERGGAEVQVLTDASSNEAQIHLDVSTGMGRFAPPLIPPGEHRFAVIDTVTGRFSEAVVLLTDGALRKPAPIVSAATTSSSVSACSAPSCVASQPRMGR